MNLILSEISNTTFGNIFRYELAVGTKFSIFGTNKSVFKFIWKKVTVEVGKLIVDCITTTFLAAISKSTSLSCFVKLGTIRHEIYATNIRNWGINEANIALSNISIENNFKIKRQQ